MQTQGDGSVEEPLNREPKPQTLITEYVQTALQSTGDGVLREVFSQLSHGQVERL